MIDFEQITILNDLKERLLAVTEEQIGFAAAKLEPPLSGERALGRLSDATITLWTLSMILTSEISLQKALGGSLVDPAVAEEHTERGMILDEIDDVVQELMWAQARNDTGFWKPVGIGIRAGWELVEMKDDKSPMAFLAKMGFMPPGM